MYSAFSAIPMVRIYPSSEWEVLPIVYSQSLCYIL